MDYGYIERGFSNQEKEAVKQLEELKIGYYGTTNIETIGISEFKILAKENSIK